MSTSMFPRPFTAERALVGSSVSDGTRPLREKYDKSSAEPGRVDVVRKDVGLGRQIAPDHDGRGLQRGRPEGATKSRGWDAPLHDARPPFVRTLRPAAYTMEECHGRASRLASGITPR